MHQPDTINDKRRKTSPRPIDQSVTSSHFWYSLWCALLFVAASSPAFLPLSVRLYSITCAHMWAGPLALYTSAFLSGDSPR
ncbi:hypothetical protein CRE_08521 [Caenorhabditis remanei]|uniref:Uncharacterized protein n=1 Tax=Caenorhabditis remanei TaxID=31234 RepID=E3N6X1_CAERE|nr:hypothetical protein CRE_08521 [Caenorhabditis remanei]